MVQKHRGSAGHDAAYGVDHPVFLRDVDVDSLGADELIQGAEHFLSALSERLASPDARREFSRYIERTSAGAEGEWHSGWTKREEPCEGESASTSPVPLEPVHASTTVPALLRAAEGVSHTVEHIQSQLTGVAAEAFDSAATRADVLGIPGGRQAGFRQAVGYLAQLTKSSRRTVQRRVTAHQLVGCRSRGPAQEPEEPSLPAVQDRFRDGQVSAEKVGLMADAVERVRRAAAEAGVGDSVEGILHGADAEFADRAEEETYDGFRSFVADWLVGTTAAIDQDGTPPPEELRARNRRELRFERQDGENFIWTVITDRPGHERLLVLEHAANNPRGRQDTVSDVINSWLADPTSADTLGQGGQRDLFDDDAAVGEAGGEHMTPTAMSPQGQACDPSDRRTRRQRSHDAFFSVVDAGFNATGNGLSQQGGAPAQILATLDLRTLMSLFAQSGSAPPGLTPEMIRHGTTEEMLSTAGYSGATGPGFFRQMLCHAKIIPVVLGGEGQVLDVGRDQRLFTTHQRRALVARDGGCAAPGCTAPSTWCEAHHVLPWEHDGNTAVNNGVLLCNAHHQSVHLGEWSIRIEDGVPWFVPAPYIDPDQTPRRNTYWRPRRTARPRTAAS